MTDEPIEKKDECPEGGDHDWEDIKETPTGTLKKCKKCKRYNDYSIGV